MGKEPVLAGEGRAGAMGKEPVGIPIALQMQWDGSGRGEIGARGV